MLVVTRKLDESLIISDNIEITVLEIGKDKVKIGINAPKEVKVIRSELKDARQTNQQPHQQWLTLLSKADRAKMLLQMLKQLKKIQ